MCLLVWSQIPGDQVTTLSAELNVSPQPKLTLLPLLTVLFLVSYALMTLLIVEQSQTIESQKDLIRNLIGDSLQLTGLKSKAIQDKNAHAKAEAQAQAQAKPPSSQGKQHDHPKNNSAGKAHQRTPEKPPKPTADGVDERRIVVSI